MLPTERWIVVVVRAATTAAASQTAADDDSKAGYRQENSVRHDLFLVTQSQIVDATRSNDNALRSTGIGNDFSCFVLYLNWISEDR
jgi:hypothetical protein